MQSHTEKTKEIKQTSLNGSIGRQTEATLRCTMQRTTTIWKWSSILWTHSVQISILKTNGTKTFCIWQQWETQSLHLFTSQTYAVWMLINKTIEAGLPCTGLFISKIGWYWNMSWLLNKTWNSKILLVTRLYTTQWHQLTKTKSYYL